MTSSSLPAEAPPSCEVPSTPCGNETVITLMTGCVHEHLVELSACQHHVEALANGAYCGPCVDADGQLCPLMPIKELARV